MNIDVRNIEGKVLKNMEILLKNFTSTAKATRYVIEQHFDLKATIERKEKEIERLEKKIDELEQKSKNDNQFRKSLKGFLEGDNN